MVRFEIDHAALRQMGFDPAEAAKSLLEEKTLHKGMADVVRNMKSVSGHIGKACQQLESLEDLDTASLCQELRLAQQEAALETEYYDWDLTDRLLSAQRLGPVVETLDGLPQDRAVESVNWFDFRKNGHTAQTVGGLKEMLRYDQKRENAVLSVAERLLGIYMERRTAPLPPETGYVPELPVEEQSLKPKVWKSLRRHNMGPKELDLFFYSGGDRLNPNKYYRLAFNSLGNPYLVRDWEGKSPYIHNKKVR